MRYPIYTLFLPVFLENNGANLGDGSTFQTYRDYCIASTVGIVGPWLAAYLVNIGWLGRRGTMALTAVCAASFAGAFTSVRTEASNIAFSSLINFWQNAFYATLYAYVGHLPFSCYCFPPLDPERIYTDSTLRYTPEVMPTFSRATGCGTAVAAGRIASLSSPFIATFANLNTPVPIWVCFGLYIVIAMVALILPFEPRHFNEGQEDPL